MGLGSDTDDSCLAATVALRLAEARYQVCVRGEFAVTFSGPCPRLGADPGAPLTEPPQAPAGPGRSGPASSPADGLGQSAGPRITAGSGKHPERLRPRRVPLSTRLRPVRTGRYSTTHAAIKGGA